MNSRTASMTSTIDTTFSRFGGNYRLFIFPLKYNDLLSILPTNAERVCYNVFVKHVTLSHTACYTT